MLAETVSVLAETVSVLAETVSVLAETVSMLAETVSVFLTGGKAPEVLSGLWGDVSKQTKDQSSTGLRADRDVQIRPNTGARHDL